MKKNFLKILNLAGCLLITSINLTSCYMFASDDETAQKQFSKFLSATKTEDLSEIKNCFGKVIKDSVNNLDEQIDKFLLFYEGKDSTIVEKSIGPVSFNSSKGYHFIYVDYFYNKVITSTNLYMINVYSCTLDTKNRANEGIWNIFVVKCSLDEENPKLVYDMSGWEDTDKFRGITMMTYEEMKGNNKVLNSK